MSSDSKTESLKKPAEELTTNEEPNPKKAKVASPANKAQEANSESTADTTDKSNNTPSKAANGTKQDKLPADREGDSQSDDDEDDDGFEVHPQFYDPKVAQIVEQVEGIQMNLGDLNEKASDEILKVEQKYNKLRRPHFVKRNELLKDIENFWLTSMANHPIIAPMIESAEDEDCLHHLVNLDVEEYDDIKSGYVIKLHFRENPYIANEVIEKHFQIATSEGEESSGLVSKGTSIEFKNTPEGQRLKQIVTDSLNQLRRSRPPQFSQGHQSFFAWLADKSESSRGEDCVADTIKEQIWPNPLEYFFARPDEYHGMSDEESDEDDEEINDEEIDDEDIDDEDIDDDEDASGVQVISRHSEIGLADDEEIDDDDDEGPDDEYVDDEEDL